MTISNDVVALIALVLISTFFYCLLVLAIDSTRRHTSQHAYGQAYDAFVRLFYVLFLRPLWLPLRAIGASIARFFVSLRQARKTQAPATPAQAQPATRQQPIIVHVHNYVPGATSNAPATPAPNAPLTVDTILHGPMPSVLAPDQDTGALDESEFLPVPDASAPAQAPATHKRANGTRAS